MPDLIMVKGMALISKIVKADEGELFIALTFELMGPFGVKYIEVRVAKDGLIEPGGPSA
jgi:hypothetical protein